MKAHRYDFPARMRGLPSAERELSRLGRSISVARERRDTQTVAYLEGRLARAARVYRLLQRQEGTTTP
ncbi:hypothetical protein AB0J20_18220 [Micromonospora costi]|uniref:hypothetical protein n=1 Tax=Micromonospora costi TaxID=1530042 RepID=UPI0033F48B24